MGRMYVATFTAISVSAAQDLFEVNAPSTAAVLIHEVRFGQITDVGDANEEQLRVSYLRGYSTSGSGGATVTPAQMFASAAFGGTVERNNTTVASTGSPVTLLTSVWNTRTEFLHIPTPETRPVLAPSARFVVRITAPSAAITMDGSIVFEAVS